MTNKDISPRKAHGRENDSVAVLSDAEKSDVALREEAILQFWQEQDIFNQSVMQPAGSDPKGDYVFYDGPPFATGLPHYGHILAGTIKDAIPRFWTMNGYRVRRKWGWDCHGLPLENLIEKKLGLSNKRDIEDYGIKNFNEAARAAVMEYADDWKEIIPRMGRWCDMDDDYKTMDSTYTESVWWVFKQLHEKGLVFEGFKTMHLCPRCGTTLSNFEVNQGYKDIKDIAVTVKLPLLDDAGAVTDTSFLVWTTTPWTLPGNLAAAVNQEFTYAKVRVTTDEGEELVILAEGRLAQLGDVPYEVVEKVSGAELVGRRYQPPFPYLQDLVAAGTSPLLQNVQGDFKNAWTIYHADYVELGEDGTGGVHLAPAYGEDDMVLAQEHDVPIFHHVTYEGKFMDYVTDFAGQLVKPKDDDESGVSHLDADIEIVKALKASDRLFKKENITHSYPHCWRDDTPLLNYATTSWFVNVPKIKDELVANNNSVNWVPDHVGANRFGKWLEGARDWAVSRQRYWGAPLPIWKNPQTGEYKVFGSLSELKEHVPKSCNEYYVMRHGQSQSNVDGVISANIDNDDPITEEGKQQVMATAAELKDAGIELIIHSPFMRTTQTAELMRDALGLPAEALVVDEQIREYKLVDALEGKPWSEYSALFKSREERYTKEVPGNENRRDVHDRMGAFLYQLEEKYQDKKILIVTHGGPLSMLQAVSQGYTATQALAAVDKDGYFTNGQWEKIDFTPLSHNDHYELDFHRPYIDDLVLEEDGVQLERVPDVFDCWFESGSMPYGQRHFMGEAQSDFDPANGLGFPANFISESVDQTRGWFYSLMVLGVALFGKSPFDNAVTNGLVLAEDGRKMSKSLQNYPDPIELVHRQGADSMRFYLLSSSIIKGEDLNFSEKEVQELQRKNIGRLHNVLAMYETYADGTEARADSDQVLDVWIVNRLQELINDSTAGYRAYELDKATRPINDFIDDLSVWYLRRSRDRLKGADEVDRTLALATLRYVLETLAKVMAPAMPFYAEYLYRAVRAEGAAESVHLSAWPSEGLVDDDVIGDMNKARHIVSGALEARVKAGIKVRQPIRSVTAAGMSPEFVQIILDEVNAKNYHAKHTADVIINTELNEQLLAEGAVRELMRAVQGMRKDADLQPGDQVTVTIATDEAGQAAVNAHLGELQITVGAKEVTFAETTGVEVTAGDYRFLVAITE